MDPITSVVTVTALAAVIYQTSNGLYKFIRGTRIVDERVNALYAETQSLARMVDSVQTTINSPSLRSLGPEDLWLRVEASIKQCQRTMESFQRIVDEIEAKRARGTLQDALRHFRLVFSEEQIATLKNQLQGHISSLSLIVQTLNLNMTALSIQAATSTSTTLISALDPRFDELQAQINDVLRAIQNTPARIHVVDPATARTDEQLRLAANQIASRASEILGSRTTVWGGSHRSQHGVQSLTTGSELGDPMSSVQFLNIADWASNTAPLPDVPAGVAELAAADVAPSSTVPTTIAAGSIFDSRSPADPTGRQMARTSTMATDLSVPAIAGDDSEEDETEIELLTMQQVKARQYSETDRLRDAEKLYRRILGKLSSLSRSSRLKFDEKTLKHELASISFRQNRLDDAAALCTEVIREALLSDPGSRLPLDASYLLAQVKLRAGDFQGAKNECKKAMVSWRKLSGKESKEYLQAVSLMSFIFQQSYLASADEDNEDEIESESYGSILPAGFINPDFKPPLELASLPQSAVTVPVVEDPVVPQHLGSEHNSSGPDPQRSPAPDVHVTAPDHRASFVLESDSPHPNSAPPPYELFHSTNVSPDEGYASAHASGSVPARSSTFGLLASELPPPMIPSSSSHSVSAMGTSHYGFEAQSRDSSSRGSVIDDSAQWSSRARTSSRAESTAGSLRGLTHRDRHSSFASSWERLMPITGNFTVEQLKSGVESLQLGGFDVEDKKFNAEKALFWASEHGRPSAVALLISGWTMVKSGKKFGIKTKDTQEVEKADVEYFDQMGMTSLHFACRNGHVDVVKLLVAAKAPVQAETLREANTPLHFAAAGGSTQVVEVLIGAGARINSTNNAGHSPFMRAAARGHIETADLLRHMRADVSVLDRSGATSLHHAAQLPDTAMLTWLIEVAGLAAKIDAVDKNGRTTMQYAVHANRLENIKRLISHGANPQLADNDNDNLLHNSAMEGHTDLVLWCLDNGFRVDTVNRHGETALIMAAQHGHDKVVELLLARGADCNRVDASGNRPLNHAVRKGHARVQQLLKAAGAVASVTSDRRESMASRLTAGRY